MCPGGLRWQMVCAHLRDPEFHDPGAPRAEWQHEAAGKEIPGQLRGTMVRSQAGAQCWCGFVNASAGVAFQMTLLATTVQHVRGQGCWEGGVFPESAAARICREAGGRVATNTFVRSVDLGVPRMAEKPAIGGCGRWTRTVWWSSTGS